MIINNIGINFAGGGGGGKSAVLETKDYTITENGITLMQPSEGVDGISGGTISVNVPQVNEDRLPGWIYPYGSTTALTENDFIEYPKSQGSMQQYALYFKSSLKTVRLPYWIRDIGRYAMGSQNLESINLDRITKVQGSAFSSDGKLTDVGTFINIKYFGDNAFDSCSSLSGDIVLKPESTTGMSAGNVFDYASGITSFTFMDNVYRIKGAYTGLFFGNHKMTGVTMFDFTRNVQVPVLTDNDMGNFSKINPNYEVRVPQVLYNDWIAAPGWRTIASHIVSYPNPLSNNTIHYTTTDGQPITASAMTEVGKWNGIYVSDSYDATTGGSITMYGLTRFPSLSLSDKRRLVSVEMPDSITFVEGYAFSGCTALTSLKLSKNIEYCDYAFVENTQLSGLIFGPNFLQGTYARSSTNLNKIAFQSLYPPHIGQYAFMSVPSSGTIYVPSQSLAIYQDWFNSIVTDNPAIRQWTLVGVSDWTNWDFPA